MPEPRTIDELADWIAEAVTVPDTDSKMSPSLRVRNRAVVALLSRLSVPHLGACNTADKRQ